MAGISEIDEIRIIKGQKAKYNGIINYRAAKNILQEIGIIKLA